MQAKKEVSQLSVMVNRFHNELKNVQPTPECKYSILVRKVISFIPWNSLALRTVHYIRDGILVEVMSRVTGIVSLLVNVL